jgi:hypothetical protein
MPADEPGITYQYACTCMTKMLKLSEEEGKKEIKTKKSKVKKKYMM